MGLALLNSCSLHELSEIRRLIDAGSCLMILGGWLDLILMYCGRLLGFCKGNKIHL